MQRTFELRSFSSSLRNSQQSKEGSSEEPRPEHEGKTGRVVQSSWLRFPFFIGGWLFSKEQDLSAESGMGTDGQTEETKSVDEQVENEAEERSE